MNKEPTIVRNELDSELAKNCIYDSGKLCGYPNRLNTSDSPKKVFIISSTRFSEIANWFKDIFEQHVRTENDLKFEIVFFTDLATFDFCSNVCIPIHESWFTIAIIKNELLPQYAERGQSKLISGFALRSNPNVFFEVGLALGTKKDVIVYLGNDQDLPTDWENLIKWVIEEPSESLSPKQFETMMKKLEYIIRLDPFLGRHAKWM